MSSVYYKYVWQRNPLCFVTSDIYVRALFMIDGLYWCVGNNLDKLVKKQGSYSWVHTTTHHISISNLQFKKNLFDHKKCFCSDNQYNFDVPWENVWHSRFHLKVSKTCYNMLIYWKIKYDSIKKNVYIILKNIPDSRKKPTKPHLQQLLHYMKYDIFFLLPSSLKTCMYKVSSYKSNCHLYIR